MFECYKLAVEHLPPVVWCRRIWTRCFSIGRATWTRQTFPVSLGRRCPTTENVARIPTTKLV